MIFRTSLKQKPNFTANKKELYMGESKAHTNVWNLKELMFSFKC